MKNNYKILVLSDLSSSTSNILRGSISLAKKINGDIHVFHVKKPTHLVDKENQLSAMRTINQAHTTINKKIQNVIKPVSTDYNIDINYSFAFGNLKDEINNYILKQNPDVIVIGKRKSKTLNFIGDNLSDYLLKKYNGTIMIVENNNSLEPNSNFSLGIFNNSDNSLDIPFAKDLLKHTAQPIKSFKIVKSNNTIQETTTPLNKKTIEFVFEKSDNSIQTLSKYLTKNKIDLFLVDRGNKHSIEKTTLFQPDLKDFINNLNVPLLLINN